MSTDFYEISIQPYAAIIIKIYRAYTNSQEDFEDYYQEEVCLRIWRTRISLNAIVAGSLLFLPVFLIGIPLMGIGIPESSFSYSKLGRRFQNKFKN